MMHGGKAFGMPAGMMGNGEMPQIQMQHLMGGGGGMGGGGMEGGGMMMGGGGGYGGSGGGINLGGLSGGRTMAGGGGGPSLDALRRAKRKYVMSGVTGGGGGFDGHGLSSLASGIMGIMMA